MSEITRVPLQPVAKGSLAKVWLGVIVAVLVGIGLAWAARPVHSAKCVDALKDGNGKSPTTADVALDQLCRPHRQHRQGIRPWRKRGMPMQGVIPGFSRGCRR
jgi:FKBP-type peptidyl-prolyl cis-trans isomerase FkpA